MRPPSVSHFATPLRRATYQDRLEKLVHKRTQELLAVNAKLRREIAERKAAENMLRESEAKYVALVENAGVGVVVVQNGLLQFANQAMAGISGYSLEELTGMPVKDLAVPEDKAGIAGAFGPERKRGPQEPLLQISLLAKDGAVRIIEESSTDLMFNGRPAILSVFRDVTDELTMEQEIQKVQRLESIGLLAGGIAHDFRNILIAVVGNLSLAKLQLSPEDRVFGLLDRAEKAATRAGELTQQLLTFARGGAPVKKVVSIGALLRETVALSLQGSTVWCELSIPDDLWPADIDASQISQVISNLLINAIEAMPRGGKITVGAENSPAGGRKGAGLVDRDHVIFSVRDRGVGIPKELLTKIFDPYFTTKAKGSGLGLATCYAIIKRHSGSILVDSEPGMGSTFSVFLPAAPGHEPVAAPGKGALRRGRGRVLFMEDDDLVRQTAKTILEFLGYEVEFAAGGEDAIEKYRLALEAGHPFRVAVLDLVVEGGLGGKEAGRRLREMDPKARLIVSSGYSNDPILANHAAFGFDAALAKPYETKDLADVLARMAEDE